MYLFFSIFLSLYDFYFDFVINLSNRKRYPRPPGVITATTAGTVRDRSPKGNRYPVGFV
jgi:hypothetical protein